MSDWSPCHCLSHCAVQVSALQDDLASTNAGQRPGTSGMSAALRQQVLLLQVGNLSYYSTTVPK
jgi:hypothetical protein